MGEISSEEALLESIKQNVRRAFIHYKEKNVKSYAQIMKEEIPQQIDEWIVQFDEQDRPNKKEYMRALLIEEVHRVESAWVTSEFLDAYLRPAFESIKQELKILKSDIEILMKQKAMLEKRQIRSQKRLWLQLWWEIEDGVKEQWCFIGNRVGKLFEPVMRYFWPHRWIQDAPCVRDISTAIDEILDEQSHCRK